MMNTHSFCRFVSGFRKAGFAFIVFCIGLSVQTHPGHAETVYSIGVVPQFEPRKLANIWLPIIEELEHKTGLKFKMKGSPKIPDFEVSFLREEFDFAYMNPYHAMLASEEGKYIPVVKDGSRSLYGILVVRKDDPISDVSELNDGGDIAFPAPNALGASLLMRADLTKRFDLNFNPVYVQTHSSVYLNVVLGKVRAGGGVVASLKGQSDEIQNRLRILYKTRAMAPHPIMAHQRVPGAHRELVRNALFEIGQTERGKELLSGIPIREVSDANVAEYRVLKDWGIGEFYVEH